MPRQKRENKWKNLGIQIDETLYELLKKESEENSRTLTATLEIILRKHFAEQLKKE